MSKVAIALASLALAAVPVAALAQAQDHANHTAAPAPAAAPAAARPTITSSIKDLLANDQTRAVVEKHMPGVSQHPALPQFQHMTLAQLGPVSQGAVTAEMIAAIDADLKALPAA